MASQTRSPRWFSLPPLRQVLALPFPLVPALLTAQNPALPTARDSNAIAIIGVTVIDVVTGARVPEQTVVVRGTRVVAVGPSARLRPPAGACNS